MKQYIMLLHARMCCTCCLLPVLRYTCTKVSTPEMAEVFAINALAPAIINARLRSFMESSGPLGVSDGGSRDTSVGDAVGGTGLKFIVNVSTMEGRVHWITY